MTMSWKRANCLSNRQTKMFFRRRADSNVSGGLLVPCWIQMLLMVLLLQMSPAWGEEEQFSTTVASIEESNNKSRALIHFHNADVHLLYKSSVLFDPKGMEHLYTITNMFLDLIQPKTFPADIFVNNTDDVTKILVERKEELLQNYLGLVIVAVVGLVLSAALPIIGFVFCLCRCVGKCGAHTEPYEKRYDTCKRLSLGIFLSAFVIAILFGIVCAFVTNEYVEQGVEQLPDKLNDSLDDVSLYLKNTKTEISTLLKTNFAELRTALDALLDKSGDIVKTRLAETSKASAIENLTNIVEGLSQVHGDLLNIIRSTRSLHIQVNQLDQSLERIRNRLQVLLSSCSDRVCEDIQRQYGANKLTVTSSLYRLPDVTDIAQKIADFIHDDIEAEVRKGKQSLDRISILIQQAVDRTVPEIKLKLKQVGKELENHSDDLCHIIDKVELQKGRRATVYVKQYSDDYGSIRHYVGLALCCAVLLITICFACGLFCGFCGQKPHPYGDDTCSRVTGANFLIAAVYLGFLLSPVLLFVTTVLFLTGGLAERVVCDPIQDPQNGQVFEVVDRFLPLEDIYPDARLTHLPIPELLKKCHRNLSIYNVLELENIFNITEAKHYKERYKLDDYVAELRQQIALNPAVLILTEQARRQLQELAESEFARLDFESFTDTLKQPVTPISLNEVQKKLEEVLSYLQTTRPEVASNVAHEKEILAYLQKEIVVNISLTMNRIKENLNNVQNNILFNKTSFREMINELLHQAEQAQLFIQTQGRSEILNLADEFTSNFTELLDEYAKLIENKVQNEIGQCGPVSQAFNASVVNICKNIVSPYNGFWASIGWCIILFLPAMALAVLLSSSYRKTDPYTGPLVESESMYESYRDNIPLANSAHKKRRLRQHETYDNRNGYVPDYMLGAGEDAARFRREAYPHPSSHGGRYSRMDVMPASYSMDPSFKPSAPANTWGNPDYSSSSSNVASPDYERPPPYYFPGPGNSVQS